MAFERISIDHRIMAGVPCVRGTRIPVATVVGMVAEGMTVEADVSESLRFAVAVVDQGMVPLQASA